MTTMGTDLMDGVEAKALARLGIQKATVGHARIKASLYGGPGAGKTYTSLLWATELVKRDGGRILLIDTERGSDLYAEDFDFDVMHSRSLRDATDALALDGYTVVIVDSVTHLWESAQEGYLAKLKQSQKEETRQRAIEGDLQFQDWRHIKRPYRKFIHAVVSCDKHVILCGRLSEVFDTRGNTMKKIGERMNSEKDTAYETHLCFRMAAENNGKGMVNVAYLEKARGYALQGKRFENPTFGVLEPVYAKIAGHTQAEVPDGEEAAERDSDLFGELGDKAAHMKAAIEVSKLIERHGDLFSEKVGAIKDYLGVEELSIEALKEADGGKLSKTLDKLVATIEAA